MFYGTKVYYEILTGKVLQVIPPQAGEFVVPTTKKEDFELYDTLRGRIPATVASLQLDYPYGDYAEEFATMTPVKVNVMTGAIQFSQNPKDPDTPVITPVSDRVNQVESALAKALITSVTAAAKQRNLELNLSSTEKSLAGVSLQHAALNAAHLDLKAEVLIYREITAALLTEVAMLKSQLGGGKDE